MNLRDFRTGLMGGGMGRFNQPSAEQGASETVRRDKIESAEWEEGCHKINRKIKKNKSNETQPKT